jgi:hypothetical protein
MNDADVWWHMRSGEWILQNHQLPRTDPFSVAGAGKPWVAYSWPFGVLIYEIARNWDRLGIVAFMVFAWIAITLALNDPQFKAVFDDGVAGGVPASSASGEHWQVIRRPS